MVTDFHDNLHMSRRIQPIPRALQVEFSPNPLRGSAASFLWGPRQTGKSTLLRQQFPDARYYDLLDTELAAALAVRPRTLHEEVLADRPAVVILDEVQKIPGLLSEVHWLLENTSTRFVLCGSSARGLRRKGHNLLGGRGIEFHLLPLTTAEVPNLDLAKVLNHGALPAHYLSPDPQRLLRAYVNAYLKEEIIDASVTRNMPAFSRFLQIVALTHGRQLNYANIARETGVAAATVRNYYQILKDTLLGFEIEPWRRVRKRRLVETSKFFLFDIGVANYLNPETVSISEGSDLFGRAFEHFLLNEIRAYLSYRDLQHPLSYWRTSSGLEVDAIVGDMELAVEFKAAKTVRDRDLQGLRALAEEHDPGRRVVVSRESRPRRTGDGIDILPWRAFCELLWGGELVN